MERQLQVLDGTLPCPQSQDMAVAREDNQRAILYDKLWREADAMTAEWSDEEQEYYFEITD